jgi:hypothetical protein
MPGVGAVKTTLLPIVEIAAVLRPTVDVTEHDAAPASRASSRVEDGMYLSESQVIVSVTFRIVRSWRPGISKHQKRG